MKNFFTISAIFGGCALITTSIVGVTNPHFNGPVAKTCAIVAEAVYLPLAPLTIAVTDGPTAADGLRNLHNCSYNY